MSYNKTKLFQSFIVVPLLLTSVSMTALTDSVQKYVEAQSTDSKVTISSEEAALTVEREQNAAKIDAYFASKGLPILVGYGMKFVLEAEKHEIPYNLLPAIAMAESTGCKYIIPGTNNCWGWGGGKIKFKSLDVAIETISTNLGGNNPTTARYYDNKTIQQILEAYNPPKVAPKYTGNVLSIMNKIDSTEVES